MTINKRKTYLFLAGAVLMLVGFYIGFMPTGYLEQFISNSNLNPNILSEMRGMGGSLFIFGVFIFSGTFFYQIEKITLIISALIFVSFSVFRVVSILIDGMPSQSIFIALFIEVMFAATVLPLLLPKNRQLTTEIS